MYVVGNINILCSLFPIKIIVAKVFPYYINKSSPIAIEKFPYVP